MPSGRNPGLRPLWQLLLRDPLEERRVQCRDQDLQNAPENLRRKDLEEQRESETQRDRLRLEEDEAAGADPFAAPPAPGSEAQAHAEQRERDARGEAEARSDRRLEEFEAESQAENEKLRKTLETALRNVELYEQERLKSKTDKAERKAQKVKEHE